MWRPDSGYWQGTGDVGGRLSRAPCAVSGACFQGLPASSREVLYFEGLDKLSRASKSLAICRVSQSDLQQVDQPTKHRPRPFAQPRHRPRFFRNLALILIFVLISILVLNCIRTFFSRILAIILGIPSPPQCPHLSHQPSKPLPNVSMRLQMKLQMKQQVTMLGEHHSLLLLVTPCPHGFRLT